LKQKIGFRRNPRNPADKLCQAGKNQVCAEKPVCSAMLKSLSAWVPGRRIRDHPLSERMLASARIAISLSSTVGRFKMNHNLPLRKIKAVGNVMLIGAKNDRLNMVLIFFGILSLGAIMSLAGCGRISKGPSSGDLAEGHVTLLWKEVPGAASYNIYVSRSPGVTKLNGHRIPNVTNPTIVNELEPGQTYYFVVTAVNRSGESIESKELSYDAVADKIGLVYWQEPFEHAKQGQIFETADTHQAIEATPGGTLKDPAKPPAAAAQSEKIADHEEASRALSEKNIPSPTKAGAESAAGNEIAYAEKKKPTSPPVEIDKGRNARRLEAMRLQAARKLVDSHFYIFFERNSNKLTPQAIQKLDRIYRILSDNSNAKVALNGYSDESGAPSFNQMVSEVRAYSVKSYLSARGIKPSRMMVRGHGPQNFLASNENAEGRRLNRRVEIELIVP
jgi:outer membrane protein OmpA-like peptidoglycan-associated protein